MSSRSETEIDPVIRIPNVVLSRGEVERLVGVAPFRFEPSKHGEGYYAQFNPALDGGWEALIALMNQVGPAIRDCVKGGQMGSPEIDVGWIISSETFTRSLRIPEAVISAVLRFGFDLVVSAYLAE